MGNYHLKEFHSGYGFEFEKELSKLPITEVNDNYQFDKLSNALKNGDKKNVTLINDSFENIFCIEANPQYKKVKILDQNNKIISKTTLENKILKQNPKTKNIIKSHCIKI